MADEQEEILETNVVNMDFQRMRQTHELAGYREGVESGKEANLQQGFNEGFAHGVMLSKEWGRLRGTLRSLTLKINKLILPTVLDVFHMELPCLENLLNMCALMSLASSKSMQDSNPKIIAEITDLLSQVTQMDKNALNPQTLQHTLERKLLNQNSSRLQPPEVRNEPKDYQVTSKRNYNTERQVDGNELASAFEMLQTQDTTNGVEDLEVDSEEIEVRTDTRGGSILDTVMHAVSDDECSASLESHKTVPKDLENLWSRTSSLAEEIGISSQKILFVKNT